MHNIFFVMKSNVLDLTKPKFNFMIFLVIKGPFIYQLYMIMIGVIGYNLLVLLSSIHILTNRGDEWKF